MGPSSTQSAKGPPWEPFDPTLFSAAQAGLVLTLLLDHLRLSVERRETGFQEDPYEYRVVPS